MAECFQSVAPIKGKTVQKERLVNVMTRVQGKPKQRHRLSSATQVTVTNGVIAHAIANDTSLNSDCVCLLDKLRNFTTLPTKRTTESLLGDSISDDDCNSDEVGSASSLTSVSSLSASNLSSWLDDNFEDENSKHRSGYDSESDIVFQFSTQDNDSSIGKERNLNTTNYCPVKDLKPVKLIERHTEGLLIGKSYNQQKVLRELSVTVEAEGDCPSKISKQFTKAKKMNNLTAPLANDPENDKDAMWESQKRVFWSMKHLMATTTDFMQVLPDLLKLRFFTEEQLRVYDNFKNSSSISILRATGERIEANRSAMAIFLVALRSHNSDLVDLMHQKIFAGATSFQRMALHLGAFNDGKTLILEEESYAMNKSINWKKENFNQQKKRIQNERNFHHDHQSPSPSRYSRRPFTLCAASDPDNIRDIQQNYIGAQPNAYFKKASYSRSMTPTSYMFEVKSEDENDMLHNHQHKPKTRVQERNHGNITTEATSKYETSAEKAGRLLQEKNHLTCKVLTFEEKTSSPEKVISEKSSFLYHPASLTENNVSSKVLVTSMFSPPLKKETLSDMQEPAAISKEKSLKISIAPKLPPVDQMHKAPSRVELQERQQDVIPEAEKNAVTGKGDVDESAFDPSISSLKRSSSCNIEPIHTHKIKGEDAASVSKSGPSQRVAPRERSNSCRPKVRLSVSREESVVKETNGDKLMNVQQRLALLRQKFGIFSTLNCNVTTKQISNQVYPIDVTSIDVNQYVTELVTHCIISTRTAWVIRKCADRVDRVNQFLELLIGLNSTDVSDVLQRCSDTNKFIGDVTSTLHEESKVVASKNDDQRTSRYSRSLIDQTADIETSQGFTEKAKSTDYQDIGNTFDAHNEVGPSSPNSDCTIKNDYVSDDASSDATITPFTYHNVAQYSDTEKQKILIDVEKISATKPTQSLHSHPNKKPDKDNNPEAHFQCQINKSPNMERDDINRNRAKKETFDGGCSNNNEREAFSLPFPVEAEKVHKKSTVLEYPDNNTSINLLNNEIEQQNIKSTEQSNLYANRFQPLRCDFNCKKETSADGSRQLTRVQALIKTSETNSKFQREAKSGTHSTIVTKTSSDGSYVSRILFPITTRKKSLNRTVNKERPGCNQEIVKKETDFESNFDHQFTSDILNLQDQLRTKGNNLVEEGKTDKVNSQLKIEMPPIQSLNSTKQTKVCLSNSEKEETYSNSVTFPVKSIGEHNVLEEKEINNNKACDNTSLVTILTNGVNLSPPPSCKKRILHRVSFSDLPPIEFEVEPQEQAKHPISNGKTVVENPKITVSRLQVTGIPKISNDKLDKRPGTPIPTSDSPKVSLFSKLNNIDLPLEGNVDSVFARTENKSPPPVNEIDQINELLMDILEEIEAENISLNRCLFDLVEVNLISNQQADTVSSTYEECYQKYKETLDKDLLEDRLPENERERSVEKLLDILTNLGLETLSKCRNCILGRLCQLSSYEDYESAQKAAAAANGSPINQTVSKVQDASEKNVIYVEVENDTNIFHMYGDGRILSGEDSEFSATESDDDIHLHHRHQNTSVTSNLTTKVSEEDQSCLRTQNEIDMSKLTPAVKSGKQLVVLKKFVNVRTILTILIDEGVMEPRQVWSILGAGNDMAQKAKLKWQLQETDNAELTRLYSLPGLADLKLIMEDKELNSKLKNTSYLRSLGGSNKGRRSAEKVSVSPCLSSSVHTADLHGGVDVSEKRLSEATRLLEEHRASLLNQEQRLSYITAVIPTEQRNNLSVSNQTVSAKSCSKKEKLPLLSENIEDGNVSTDKDTSDDNVQDSALNKWCQANNLSNQSAIALRKSGYTHPDHLSGLNEEIIEELTGLSWLHKAKLWVAVENLRLNQFYKKSHSGLSDILKILES